MILKSIFRILFNFIYQKKLNNKPTINGWSVIKGKVIFGKNNHFNGAKIYAQGGVTFGNNFHSAKGLIILTQNHNWKGEKLPYDETIMIKPVVIGDNVWIGINVIILPGVSIGEGCIIQAGSVVSSSIPDLAIVGGNPAKVIKFRNSEHYEKLKKDEKYI